MCDSVVPISRPGSRRAGGRLEEPCNLRPKEHNSITPAQDGSVKSLPPDLLKGRFQRVEISHAAEDPLRKSGCYMPLCRIIYGPNARDDTTAVNIILAPSAWTENEGVEDLQRALDDFWPAGKHSCSEIVEWLRNRKVNIEIPSLRS